MQIQRYCERVGYFGDSRPGLEVLSALQKLHVCNVPFENLDVQLGNPVITNPVAAYEKIVDRGRGGWCYEQNGLFGWVLGELGFEVTRVAASVMRQSRGDVSYANHLCLLVKIPDGDTEYLVDVGFGGSMIQPIELAEAEYNQAPFRLGLRKIEDGYWRFWEDIGNGEFTFDFVPEPADEAALTDKCALLQSDPSSNFVLNLVAQIRQPKQHKTLRGRVLSVATTRGIESNVLESADELVSVLEEEFSLCVPEVADLWPKIMARHEDLFRDRKLIDTYEIRSRSNN